MLVGSGRAAGGAGRAEPGGPGRWPGWNVLSVALPTLAGALHASESDLQWFSSGYCWCSPRRCSGEPAGRPLRAQEGAARLTGAVCGRLAGCAAALQRRSSRLARCWTCGSRNHRHVPGAITTLFSEQERPRRSGSGGANFLALPSADPRRLDPDQLLVGLGVPAERSIALIGLAATSRLLPESRAGEQHAADLVGWQRRSWAWSRWSTG